MKDAIRKFALEMGVDDVGFALVKDYHSPKSPEIASIFPEAKSIIVLAYKELPNCESDNMQVAFSGRMELMEFARSCNYKLARFLDRQFKARVMTISPSYPLEMSYETKGILGDVSLRHAAAAAGLGSFGRHNLIIHPRFGTRVIFTALLCNLELPTDSQVEDLCTNCGLCAEACPAKALEEEGKTDAFKCLKVSQPHGLSANIKFWQNFVDSSPEEQKNMFKDINFWRMYQAGFIGLQYFCFNCLKSCPIGQ